mmetsp:Transcript_59179/g.171021  ORF Transcript_59179/g.171021 Transcript_59179/m.171021 type:complete len:82 (-) Transcript_59179:28-273(-)
MMAQDERARLKARLVSVVHGTVVPADDYGDQEHRRIVASSSGTRLASQAHRLGLKTSVVADEEREVVREAIQASHQGGVSG